MITSQHNLGDVQVTMERRELFGVEVVHETLKPRSLPKREFFYVDPLFVSRQHHKVRAALKKSFRSLDEVEQALELQLPQLRQ